jgi:hypothetical protein
VVADLVARLAADSGPVLSGRARSLTTSRGRRIVVALVGSAGLAAVLIGVPALLGHLL